MTAIADASPNWDTGSVAGCLRRSDPRPTAYPQSRSSPAATRRNSELLLPRGVANRESSPLGRVVRRYAIEQATVLHEAPRREANKFEIFRFQRDSGIGPLTVRTGRSFIRARHSLKRGSARKLSHQGDTRVDQRRVVCVECAVKILKGLVEISCLGVMQHEPDIRTATFL